MLRALLPATRFLALQTRSFSLAAKSLTSKTTPSTDGKLVTLETLPVSPADPSLTYMLVQLNRKPVNAFSQQVLDEMLAIFTSINKSGAELTKGTGRGVILASSIPNFFSAGIDLQEFTKSEKEWLHYWTTVRDLFYAIYTCPYQTSAIISGHAPGAGAVFALACNYRYMLRGPYGFGLNEVAVGLPVPIWLCDLFATSFGQRLAEKMLPVGKMVSADEGLAVGMVDGVGDSKEALMALALKKIKDEAPFELQPQAYTRQFIRQEFGKRMRATKQDDLNWSWGYVGKPEFQARLKELQKKLASKEKKKEA